MGKKIRKTTWRTLPIADEHSDSEESSTTTSGYQRGAKTYHQKLYSRFTSYSSQSTPTRRYPYDSTKSTRSSSTASETKITFNEDEYTRITTPRQDVLFKKGYLNKPKTYQTQTSTGNSTTSTGNSTGNGTPDHQSTDLEYESQFVFPNGFVDQNGIYYVNSFEPYPLMVYNPPTYYQEISNIKSKKCSTSGSLTESTSPHNEETSQDLSETPSNISDLNPVYNVIYPGFYVNNECQPQEPQVDHTEPRRIKKKRRRKPSRSRSPQEGTTSDCTDEESSSSSSDVTSDDLHNSQQLAIQVKVDAQTLLLQSITKEDTMQKPEEEEEDQDEEEHKDEALDEELPKYDLKPDAEEFVPMAYRHLDPNVQYIKLPQNFVPLPIINPMGEFNAFIPPGIHPINFIPHNYVNFVPNYPPSEAPNEEAATPEDAKEETTTVEVPRNHIDIAKIVSKLEEAAKEQDDDEDEDEVKPEVKAVETIPKKYTNPNRSNVRRNQRFDETRRTSWKGAVSPKNLVVEVKSINYSETLKKKIVASNPNVVVPELPMGSSPTTKKEVVASPRRNEAVVKLPNQWIPVSNRKKRKNRNMEEPDDFEDEAVEGRNEDGDLFECYDVNLLEDVVPVVKEVEVLVIPEVSDIEKELLAPVCLPPIEDVNVVAPVEVVKEVEEIKKTKSTPKKKTKKNQKTVTKRVIITDLDLTEEIVKPVVEVPVDVIETKDLPEEKVMVEDVPKEVVIVERKPKKKKKKKPLISGSLSSSNATLNALDDTYDFLLDTTLDESREKTNIEVSQELDKMIQKGMYSSLEEKMKSLNIESNDNFFKSIINNISSREASVEKNTFHTKTPDFTTLLKSTTKFLQPKPVFMEPVKAHLPTDDFLGEAAPEAPPAEEAPQGDGLYPITKAVKEWMTKTRESTPDVEILKSPSTIFKEFGAEEAQVDLLECWEDQVLPAPSSPIEEGEEALEMYESKYGQNEDFLQIKAEVEQKSSNFPKHGTLPYRAICCSIM